MKNNIYVGVPKLQKKNICIKDKMDFSKKENIIVVGTSGKGIGFVTKV